MQWFKGGEMLQPNSELQEFKNGLCQFKIAHTTPNDSGDYRCVVTTEAGSAETTATLKVKGRWGVLG